MASELALPYGKTKNFQLLFVNGSQSRGESPIMMSVWSLKAVERECVCGALVHPPSIAAANRCYPCASCVCFPCSPSHTYNFNINIITARQDTCQACLVTPTTWRLTARSPLSLARRQA
jgi:hypothetical protein